MGSMYGILRFVPIVTAILLLAGGPAGAVILYDTLGPGDSYDIAWGAMLGSSPFDGPWLAGFTFSFAGEQAYELDRIEVAACRVTGDNSVDIWLMTDAGGQPGVSLESFGLHGMMGDIDQINPLLFVSSYSRPVLSPDTPYWLVMTAPETTWATWNWASPDVPGLFAYRVGEDPWSVWPFKVAAFRIYGGESAASLPVTVPVPGAALLVVLGLSSAGWCRRARRRVRTTH